MSLAKHARQFLEHQGVDGPCPGVWSIRGNISGRPAVSSLTGKQRTKEAMSDLTLMDLSKENGEDGLRYDEYRLDRRRNDFLPYEQHRRCLIRWRQLSLRLRAVPED